MERPLIDPETMEVNVSHKIADAVVCASSKAHVAANTSSKNNDEEVRWLSRVVV